MSFLSVFSPSLRPLNPLSALFLSLAFSASLSADVIYLTNGNVMVVEKAWEESGEVKYQTGQGVQSLPKSSVRRIQEQKPTHGHAQQKYGIAAEDGNRAAQSVPKLLTEISSNVPSKAATKEVLIRLRENLKSDPSDAHSKAELVLALNSVAALQLTQGDFSSAKSSLEEALALDRRNSILLSNLAVANFQMGNFRAAEDLLLTSLEIDRKNQGTYYLLGEAYYAQEKIPQAISQWTTALQLGANSQISERLEKARRESGAHSELGTLQSAHFIIRYDRKVSDYRLGQQILTTLESLYRQLSSDLTSHAPATVAVILYPDQTYFDITQAPGWTGALFDGKIRVPTKGLSNVTSELASTLTHELTHSFIASLPGRGCPSWFNEGVAQFLEGKSSSNYRRSLEHLLKNGQLMPLKNLRGSFVGLSAETVGLAYIEGLSAVEYLVSRFGKSSIRSIVELMAQNYNFENAFKTALGHTVSDFEAAWQQSLEQ